MDVPLYSGPASWSVTCAVIQGPYLEGLALGLMFWWFNFLVKGALYFHFGPGLGKYVADLFSMH